MVSMRTLLSCWAANSASEGDPIGQVTRSNLVSPLAAVETHLSNSLERINIFEM